MLDGFVSNGALCDIGLCQSTSSRGQGLGCDAPALQANSCIASYATTSCTSKASAVERISPALALQVITGSHDKTVKLWDLRKGKAMTTLTYHKKSVRGLALHPTEYCFASASAENIKKFRLPRVSFLSWLPELGCTTAVDTAPLQQLSSASFQMQY